MSPNKQYRAYQNNAVNTASGEELTMMLYNSCVKFIKQAKKDVAENNFEAKNKHIQKAQNIIQELMLTLDPSIELSEQMMPLYEFIHHQLQEGNISNSQENLDVALSMTTDFRDTWKQVILSTRQQKYAQGAQV